MNTGIEFVLIFVFAGLIISSLALINGFIYTIIKA